MGRIFKSEEKYLDWHYTTYAYGAWPSISPFMGCTAIQKEQLDANRCWQIPDQHLHSFLCSFTPKEPKSTQMPAAARFPSSHLASILLFCLSDSCHHWALICTSFLVQPHSFPALTATYPSQVIPQEPSFQDGYLLTVSRPFLGLALVFTHMKEGSRPWETLCTSYDSGCFSGAQITKST